LKETRRSSKSRVDLDMIKRTFEDGNKEVDDMGILIIRQEKGK
jgi:hypothetical protein